MAETYKTDNNSNINNNNNIVRYHIYKIQHRELFYSSTNKQIMTCGTVACTS